MRDFSAVCQHHATMRQVLGDYCDRADGGAARDGLERLPNALDRLTGPSYGLSDILRSGRTNQQEQSHGKLE